MASVTPIPQQALEWLIGADSAAVLLVGASDSYAALLARAGHSVTVADRDATVLGRIASRHSWIHVVAATAESLPFDPCCFSTVLAIQNFHTFAPGLALGEWARVLRPHGRIGVAYLTRDDSVPWVKKLKTLVQARLPEAMASDDGVRSTARLTESAYFPFVESTSFRMWVPSTRVQLQDNARHAPGADQLPPAELAAMLGEIAQLYDEYARVPEPLLLPYQIRCWRAEVDQSELTASLIPEDDGLSISL